MAYYRVKFNLVRRVTDIDPETGEARLNADGNPVVREEVVLKRDGQPLVKTTVVFGLHNVHRLLANSEVRRVSVNRFIRKLAETTAEEIAAGEAEYQREQIQRRMEATRAEVAALEASLQALNTPTAATDNGVSTPTAERQDQ